MARQCGPGYHKYRGRGGGGSVVLKVIVAVLALVLVAGIVFLLLMGEYVEYTDGGVRLNLPQSSQEPEPVETVTSVVVMTDEPAPETMPPTTFPAISEDIRAVEVSVAQLLEDSVSQLVDDADGNALVVTMKQSSGVLAWQSETELAAELEVNAADDDAARAVRALAQEDELYLVARIDCFRDGALARSEKVDATLMTRGGNIWYDASGNRWVSPVSDTVTDYLVELCLELADMGFDEILLDSAGFPDFGEVNVLATDERRPEDRTAAVEAFYEKLTKAVADRGVVLSIQAGKRATQMPGDESYSGITARILAQYAGRVWLPSEAGAEQYAALLEEAGAEEAEERLVLENGEKDSGSWYITG